MKRIGLATVATLCLAVAACNTNPEPDENGLHWLTIDSTALYGYPAALVSLDEQRITAMPGSAEEGRNLTYVADLYVEPRDPEILAICAEKLNRASLEGATHAGQDTRVALVDDVHFERLLSVPADLDWQSGIGIQKTVQGRVFVVHSSTGKYYKVRLEKIRGVSTDNAAITIAYREIPDE